jgi:ABC-type uncharacterized transport system permease subunit
VVQLFGTPAAPVATAVREEVAGVAAEESQDVTLETISVPDPEALVIENAPDVAPASIETRPVTPPTGEPIDTTSSPSDPVPLAETVPAQNDVIPPAEPQEVVVLYSDLATTSRPGAALLTEGEILWAYMQCLKQIFLSGAQHNRVSGSMSSMRFSPLLL